MYTVIQVQVVTTFSAIVHFSIRTAITKSNLAGTCKYWQFENS